MEDKLRPVISPKPTRERPPALHILTRCVRELGILTGLIAVGASIWYFSGFAENDWGVLHLLNAALVAFGGGSLFYIPAFWITIIAHKALGKNHYPRILPLLLILPWFPFCWQLLKLGNIWAYVALYLLIFALLVVIWMIAIWRRRRRG